MLYLLRSKWLSRFREETILTICIREGYAVDIVCFKFIPVVVAGKETETVTTSVLLQLPGRPASRILAVEVLGDVTAILEEPSIHEPLHLVLIDHIKNIVLRIMTGLDGSIVGLLVQTLYRVLTMAYSTPKEAYDMYLADGNCIICSAGTRQTIIHAYLNVMEIIGLNKGSLEQPPHFSKTITFSDTPTTSVPFNRNGTEGSWVPSRPWNTPSRWTSNQFLLLSTSDERDGSSEDAIVNHPMLLAQWLDPPQVVRWLKTHPDHPCPFDRRTFVTFPDRQTRVSHNGILFSPSTCWKHMVWVNEPGPGNGDDSDTGTRLTMIKLPSPGEWMSPEDIKASCRNLDVPLDLSTATFVKFCDEFGLLAVGLNRRDFAGIAMEQEVHLFWY